ncbi:hypothetical protein PBY51_007711 [Eleginops maclovinus]|uniref:Uncharacterized protein n=1 Tax=Eleginops maclovinus TaxID=56733 RepID=A0AAN8AIH2_ELEMC|nr:hypothetical protein PBY51_007711 [Eleginops maclovinus]
MVPGVDKEVLAVRHDGHSRVRLLLCERTTSSGKRGDPLVMTTQTLERVSPGKKGHQSALALLSHLRRVFVSQLPAVMQPPPSV